MKPESFHYELGICNPFFLPDLSYILLYRTITFPVLQPILEKRLIFCTIYPILLLFKSYVFVYIIHIICICISSSTISTVSTINSMGMNIETSFSYQIFILIIIFSSHTSNYYSKILYLLY